MKEELKEAKELLRECLNYINNEYPEMYQTVYINPIQQLRNEANRLEQKEAFLVKVRDFISKENEKAKPFK